MFGVSSAVLPLASRRKCTGFLAVLAATSLAVLCPRPATAQYGGTGSWSFTDVFHGESKQINGVEQPLGTDRPISAGGAWANDGADVVTPNDQYKTSAAGSILIKGRDRIVGTWVPPYSPYSGSSSTATPTPPATVTILVNSGAIAGWGSNWYYPEKLQGSLTQLDNGFGDPATLYPGSDRNWYCGGLHLKTLSTAGGSWVSDYNYSTKVYRVELPFDINMAVGVKASGSGYPPDPHNPSSVGTVSGRLGGVTVQGDTRSVQIGRNGAPAAKTANDSTLDKTKDEWVDADGTGHGHSRYSYWYGFLNGSYSANYQTFLASITGSSFTNNTLTAPWSPAGGIFQDGDDAGHSTQEMPVSGGSNQRTVTYNYKDKTDGAQASAQYVLTLHEPYEILTQNPRGDSYSGSKHLTEEFTGPIKVNRTVQVTYNISMTASFSGETEKYLGAKLGLNLQPSWSKQTSESTAYDFDVPDGQIWFLEERDHYYVYTGTMNTWSTEGFTGVQPYSLTEIPLDELARMDIRWNKRDVPPPIPGGGG